MRLIKQIEQPLYPKLSPIYNKILQLAIAILLIVFLMNFWVKSRDAQQMQIQVHANKMAKLYLAQAATSVMPYLVQKQSKLQQYADTLVLQPLVKSVHIYDITGQSIASSEQAESINDLFGLSILKINQTDKVIPFVQALHSDKLHGYIRLSLHRSILVDELAKDSRSQYDIMRLLMIVAGVIGFLLTRGLNRFSRQGYRPPKS
ncbi:MAG: membrane protein [Cognaticolwellia sp.]|jgi:membrane protein